MIRILIAEDHVVVRSSLKRLCELMGDIIVAGEAASGEEVIELLHAKQFDMILLGMNMSGPGGVDLVERIRAQHERLPILIHNMNDEPHLAKRVLQAGASGYVAKARGHDILMSAICKVAVGERFIDPAIAGSMTVDNLARANRI